MALITKDGVKGLLQISVSTYDSLIEFLVPVVRDFVIYDILQNKFKNPYVYLQASTISFATSTKKISDSESGFLDADFHAYDNIIVEGSLRNDGIYEVITAAAASLTLDFTNDIIDFESTENALTDEDAGESVRVTKIDYPRGLKIPVSQLFSYLLNKDALKGISSEGTGSYSVSYLNDLPKALLGEFAKYKKLSW